MDDAVLRVDELVLRHWRPSDEDAVLAACRDPDIQRFTRVPKPYRREDAVAFLHRAAEWRTTGTDLALAIVVGDGDSEQAGVLLGSVGAHRLDTGEPELGYWLTPAARGRGVARRALAALAAHVAAAQPPPRTVWLQIMVENAASRRVAEAAGFVAVGEYEDPDGPCGPARLVRYELARPLP